MAANKIGPLTVHQWVQADTSIGRRLRELRVISAAAAGTVEVVGREELLTGLHEAFHAGHEVAHHPGAGGGAGGPVVRVLTGLGGVGKTSVAHAYVHRWGAEYGLVWWVNAADLDPVVVGGQFRALLEALLPEDAVRVSDPVQAVHAVLANRDRRWLLVMDNVADPDGLAGLVPASSDGHVLVTTRAGTWPDRRQAVAVPVLPAADAVNLLVALAGDGDRAAADALAGELGYLLHGLIAARAVGELAVGCSRRGADRSRLSGAPFDHALMLWRSVVGRGQRPGRDVRPRSCARRRFARRRAARWSRLWCSAGGG